MLFDLRGSGRRRTVKIVYITLAFLMGGGLVLFGIGGGGALPAASSTRSPSSSGGGDTGTDRFAEQEQAATAKARANPTDAAAWAARRPRALQPRQHRRQLRPEHGQLHRRRRRAAARGRARVGRARRRSPARTPDARVASLMVQAYAGARRARQGGRGAGGHHRGPRLRPAPTRTLATLAYQAGQIRKGDLATDKALELDRAGHARGAQAASSSRPSTQAAQAAGQAAPTPDADSGGDVAARYNPRRALVAQLAEQRTLNPKVPGSIPGGGMTPGSELPSRLGFVRLGGGKRLDSRLGSSATE